MQITDIQSFGPSTIMRRFILTFADLTAAATTQTINLMALPQGTLVKTVRMKHTVAFAGPSISAMTVSVGSAAGSATTFAAAFDVFQAVANATYVAAAATALSGAYVADTLQCKFTATGANVNVATAGQVFIDVEMWLEPDLTATAPLTNTPTPQGSGGGLI